MVDERPIRYRAMPLVAAGLDLRKGEAFGLRVDDVDFLRQRVLIHQQVRIVGGDLMLAPPKGRKEWEVSLRRSWLSRSPKGSANGRLSTDCVHIRWRRAPASRLLQQRYPETGS